MNLILTSPLAGWALPLEDVPDPVFAQRMAGDGVAIDPTGDALHAPCAGRVSFVRGYRHALNLRSPEGVELLLHVGIDTVAMAGEGFELLVSDGATVAAGQPLLRFDLDRIVRRAPSAITPVLVVAGGKVVRASSGRIVAVGDTIMEIELEQSAAAAELESDASSLRREFSVLFEHGLHARPAALLAAALRPFLATVHLQARGGRANVRSAVELMGLGVQHEEVVVVSASGEDAASALAALAEVFGASTSSSNRLAGCVGSRGLAMGPVVFLRPSSPELVETAGDVDQERRRLSAAIADVHSQLLARAAGERGAQQQILQAHAELVLDAGLHEHAQARIAGGDGAGLAWRSAIAGAVGVLGRLDDARMRERVADLRDIEQQVLNVLAGRPARTRLDLPDNAILLAEELLPSQLLDLDRERVAGIATAGGGPTSHMAIIAAALAIPTLVALGRDVLAIAPGTIVVLDAERGFLQHAPDAEQQARVAAALVERRRQQAADLAAATAGSQTRDGVTIRVCANLGAADETAAAVELGADGCGLLRTEFLFLQRQTAPSEDEQFEQYRAIRDALAPRPLTIRTMDIGGDKPIPYLPLPPEDNPALGLRGVRTSLARPDLLRAQLRAILRLHSPSTCKVMLPMVTDAGDLREVRAILQACAEELGVTALPKLGAMVETPAAALLAAPLLDEAEFLSIGSNDLSQYTLAIDRGHAALAARLDALHPAVLRLIEIVAAAGHARGREVSVCGGLASDPEAIALLVGLGIREVSAVPSMIPQIKRIVRSLDTRQCRQWADEALQLVDAAAVRRLVAERGMIPGDNP